MQKKPESIEQIKIPLNPCKLLPVSHTTPLRKIFAKA
jgi:hypothetical protein